VTLKKAGAMEHLNAAASDLQQLSQSDYGGAMPSRWNCSDQYAGRTAV
jgi:hypothetical protein